MKTVHVAVGVIKNQRSEICISKRPQGSHLAGFWEFPGGKLEPSESVFQALKRELYEELALDVHDSRPLLKITHQYPEKKVLLDVQLVTEFSGEAVGREQQLVRWVAVKSLHDYRFPEANAEIISAVLSLNG